MLRMADMITKRADSYMNLHVRFRVARTALKLNERASQDRDQADVNTFMMCNTQKPSHPPCVAREQLILISIGSTG